MNNSSRMGQRKRAGDLLHEPHALTQRQRAACKAMRQVDAFQPFHRQIVLAFMGLAVRDVRDDVGVAQLREKLRFAGKALCFFDTRSLQELQRDQISGLVVECAIDDFHR